MNTFREKNSASALPDRERDGAGLAGKGGA